MLESRRRGRQGPPTPGSRAGSGRARFAGSRPPEAPELFFNVRGLLVPGHLLGQRGVAPGQLLETVIRLNPGDNGLQFVRSDALAVVFAVFAALQEVVGALGNGLA